LVDERACTSATVLASSRGTATTHTTNVSTRALTATFLQPDDDDRRRQMEGERHVRRAIRSSMSGDSAAVTG
jgi:hypothetical protein